MCFSGEVFQQCAQALGTGHECASCALHVSLNSSLFSFAEGVDWSCLESTYYPDDLTQGPFSASLRTSQCCHMAAAEEASSRPSLQNTMRICTHVGMTWNVSEFPRRKSTAARLRVASVAEPAQVEHPISTCTSLLGRSSEDQCGASRQVLKQACLCAKVT